MSANSTEQVELTIRDGQAIITIDNPPVNALSQNVRAGLLDALDRSVSAGAELGFILCSGSTFIAGAEISELGQPLVEPHLPDVVNAFEESPIIWIAIMHGTVLGGGLELALACDYRIADSTTKFGLPEVNLGLIPGAGGTQRLPRLTNAEFALRLITSGQMVNAETFAEAHGLDHQFSVAPTTVESLLQEATDFVKSRQLERRKVSDLPVTKGTLEFFDEERIRLNKASKGAEAPLHALSSVAWSVNSDFKTGQKRERELHLKLRESTEFHALKHVFFAQRQVAKPSLSANATAREFSHIGVVGGGLMGSGIAVACLTAGLQVTLVETDEQKAQSSYENIKKMLIAADKRGKLGKYSVPDCSNRLTTTIDYKPLRSAQIVIEAVFEDLDVKQNVFKRMAETLDGNTILATNTSYLDPEAISQSVHCPERVIGLHFFSPAHIMKLLEIVKTSHTHADVIATAFAFAKRIRKVAVLAGVCDGFIGNRMLAAYRRQADYMLADGALPDQIDGAMRSFGMPMGPYELQDLTGLQIAWANRQRQAADRAPDERYVTIADLLCEAGRLGQKTQSGWYRYESSDRKPIVDNHVTQTIEQYSAENGIKRREFKVDEIQQYLMAVLANEGARIVEEGIAERDLDVDIVKIFGYGFPRWRGGPMHYAENIGQKPIANILRNVIEQSPGSWTIAKRYR